jgi:hypothetical protein
MASRLAPGSIVVTGANAAGGAGAVFRIDLVKGTESSLSSAGVFATPVGVAVEGDGRVVVADADAFGGAGGVIRVDPATKSQTTLSSGGLFSNPFDLVVEAAGTILVVDPHASGTGGVIRVDPGTGKQVMLSPGQGAAAAVPLRDVGIALEANGGIVVIEQSLTGGTQGGGQVVRINPKTGARKVVSSGGSFASATGVAVEGDGSILVADANAFGGGGGVIRVHPKTGAQSTVSSHGSFMSPLGIALVADGSILIADSDAFGTGGVIRVHPKTGVQTKVSSGKKLTGHRRLAVVPNA